MEALSVIWNEAIIRPMLNTLMVLYVISFSQMGIAIILLTVLVRVVTLPLTLKQVRQMRGHEYPAAQDARDPGTLPQRPGPRLSRDHAYVPGGRSQPHRLPGAAGSPDAYPDRPVPGIDPDRVLKTGRPGRALGQALQLDTSGQYPRGRATERHVHLARPRPTRSLDGGHPGVGFCLYVGPTKDDHDAVHRSAAAVQPDYDALDDAADDRILFPSVSKRPITLLDRLERHRYHYPVFRNRMGPSVPAAPQGASSTGAPRSHRAGSG